MQSNTTDFSTTYNVQNVQSQGSANETSQYPTTDTPPNPVDILASSCSLMDTGAEPLIDIVKV